MTNRQQIIKAARIATGFVHLAGSARDARPMVKLAMQWCDKIVGLSDDNRLTRDEQVLAVKAGGVILAMISSRFGTSAKYL